MTTLETCGWDDSDSFTGPRRDYEVWINRAFETVMGTAHYVFELFRGSQTAKRDDFVPSYEDYLSERKVERARRT